MDGLPNRSAQEPSTESDAPPVPADAGSDGPVITMYVAPELEGVDLGDPIRNEDETDAEYEERRAFFRELVSIPDVG